MRDNSAARTMTFLKPHQVDTSSLEPDASLPIFSLNNAVIASVEMDIDLANAIRTRLDKDEFIQKYLPYLRDPELPRDDDVTEFLQNYSLSPDGLVLRDGLVYVPAIDAIKVKILQQCHDSRTAGHLGQKNTLEHVSRDYF
jgi:hypothetical protein